MKSITLITVFFFFVGISSAQIVKNIGLKIGVNSSKVDFTVNPNDVFAGFNKLFEKRRNDLSIGMFIHSFNLHYLDVETELLYNKEGAEDKILVTTTENPDGIDEMAWDHEYDFIKLGFNLKPKISLVDTEIFLILGPSVNYLLKNRGAFYLNEKLKKIYFGYNLGFGAKLDSLLGFPVLVEIKYNDYITKLADNKRYKVEISSFQINIGFLIM